MSALHEAVARAIQGESAGVNDDGLSDEMASDMAAAAISECKAEARAVIEAVFSFESTNGDSARIWAMRRALFALHSLGEDVPWRPT